MAAPEVLMVDGAIKRQGDSLAPQGVMCSVWRDSNQTVTASTWTTILFNQKVDPFGIYDPATGRFAPKLPGYYRVSGSMLSNIGANGQGLISVFRNTTPPAGAQYRRLAQSKTPLAGDVSAGGSTIVYCNGTTDFFILAGYTESGGFEGNSNGEYTFADVELIGSSVGVIPEPWHKVGVELGFKNGWLDYDARVAKFFKDPHGIVHLAGLIRSGTMAAPAFTLPAGYRPFSESTNFNYVAASNSAFGMVTIYNNGDVSPWVGSNTWFDLGSINFRAEQ